MFFGFNPLNYIVSTHSVDFKSIIPLLENQDFCIVSAYDKNDKIINLNNDEWIKKNHSIYINELAEIDEKIAHQVQVESAENLPMGNTGEWQASLRQLG